MANFLGHAHRSHRSGMRVLAPLAGVVALTLALLAAAPAFAAENASLSGSVYVDSNDNGVIDAGEPSIANVSITLTGTDNTANAVSLTTFTAANGSYAFTGLPPSNASGYTITETQPAGFLDGKDTKGSAGGTVANDVISAIPVADGASATGYDFGELIPASISGSVFQDINGDGVDDSGDTHIGGVAVDLSGQDDLGNQVNLLAFTVADGTYSFTNLRPSGPDGYTLSETQPAGYFPGYTYVGSVGGTGHANSITAIPLTSGDAATGYGFTEVAPGIVSMTVSVQTVQITGPLGPIVPTGDPVAITAVLTNTTSEDATQFQVADNFTDGLNCPSDTVPAGSAMTCTLTIPALEGGAQAVDIYANGALLPNPITFEDVEHYYGATIAPTGSSEVSGQNAESAPGPSTSSGSPIAVTVDSGSNVALTLNSFDNGGLAGLDCSAIQTLSASASGACTASVPTGAVSSTHAFVANFSGPQETAADGTVTTPTVSVPVSVDYTVDAAVSGISPADGTVAGGTSVTITGQGFSGVTHVDFGNNPATSFTVNSSTSITAVAPAGTGVVDVTVTTSSGTSFTGAADLFSYVAAPTVTNVSPSHGPLAGGTIVTLTGSAFTGTTSVVIGGATVPSFTVNSDTSITFTTPAGLPGAQPIVVTTASGPSLSAAIFTYDPASTPPVLGTTGVDPSMELLLAILLLAAGCGTLVARRMVRS